MIGLILLSITVIFLDLILLPSLLGFFNSSLSSVFLISLILYFGVTKRSIVFGLIFSILLEIILGYQLGSYSISFLISCALLLFASKFISIPKSILILSLTGPSLNYAFYLIFVFMNKQALYAFRDPVLYLYYFVEIFLILNLLTYINAKKRI